MDWQTAVPDAARRMEAAVAAVLPVCPKVERGAPQPRPKGALDDPTAVVPLQRLPLFAREGPEAAAS
jgi:uncharacterized protein YbbK (DUF523 family)